MPVSEEIAMIIHDSQQLYKPPKNTLVCFKKMSPTETKQFDLAPCYTSPSSTLSSIPRWTPWVASKNTINDQKKMTQLDS
jgi:hypothetical protein